MNTDSTALQNALGVLQNQYGERLTGPRQSTQAQLCDTLAQQLGIDGAGAANLVQGLVNSGQITYVDREAAADEPGIGDASEPGAGSTGPVISLPGTLSGGGGGELIGTASPAMLMGLTDDSAQGAEAEADGDSEGAMLDQLANPSANTGPGPSSNWPRGEDAQDSDGYWRLS